MADKSDIDGKGSDAPKAPSVQDIAAMLLQPVQQTGASDADDAQQDDHSPKEGSDDNLDTDVQSDGAEQDQDDLDGAEADDEADEDERTDENADQDDEGDIEPQILDVTDDDLIDVMIDGKLEQRTLGELKKAIAGEGAIDKRLQEATETRKAAHAERTTILEGLADQERVVIGALQALDATAFKAVIPPPPAALKTSNPAQYLRHQEAYDEDQKRIKEGKTALEAEVAKLVEQRQQRLKAYGEAAAPVIAKLIPELADPTKAQAKLAELADTAKAYGYTEQEIQNALDPRMFHLVRDALAYRKLLDRSKEARVTDLSGQGKKVPRKLRSGGTTAATAVQLRAKQQDRIRQTAAQTGKVKDVAAMLVQTKGK